MLTCPRQKHCNTGTKDLGILPGAEPKKFCKVGKEIITIFLLNFKTIIHLQCFNKVGWVRRRSFCKGFEEKNDKKLGGGESVKGIEEVELEEMIRWVNHKILILFY